MSRYYFISTLGSFGCGLCDCGGWRHDGTVFWRLGRGGCCESSGGGRGKCRRKRVRKEVAEGVRKECLGV